MPIDQPITLSSEQESAVLPTTGNLLIIGTAASGKTRVAVERYRRVSEMGAAVLIVPTAAERSSLSRRDVLPGSSMGGVHALSELAIKWLKANPTIIYRVDGLQVLPSNRRDALISGLVRTQGTSLRQQSLRYIDIYSFVKRNGLTIAEGFGDAVAIQNFLGQRFPRIDTDAFVSLMIRYEKQLTRGNFIDADDVLLLPSLVTAGNESVPPLCSPVAHLIVDDAHLLDTRGIRIVLSLPYTKSRAILADDDQAANQSVLETLLQLASDGAVRVCKLQTNFRTGDLLVAQALRQAERSNTRITKSVEASTLAEAKVEWLQHTTMADMLKSIVYHVQKSVQSGVHPEDIGIFTTIIDFIAPTLAALKDADIKTRVWSPSLAYGGDFPQLAASVVRFARDPRDADAIMLIGRMTASADISAVFQQAVATCSKKKIPLEQVFGSMEHGEDCMAVLRSVVALIKIGPSGLVEWVSNKLGAREGDVEGLALVRGACLGSKDWGAEGLSKLLVKAAAGDAEFTPMEGAVNLLPIERCGGLEFDVVHIVGYSKTLIPRDGTVLEEGRRLSYKGITRATLECYLHHADKLRFHENDVEETLQPSPLLADLGIKIQQEKEIEKESGPVEAFRKSRGGPKETFRMK